MPRVAGCAPDQNGGGNKSDRASVNLIGVTTACCNVMTEPAKLRDNIRISVNRFSPRLVRPVRGLHLVVFTRHRFAVCLVCLVGCFLFDFSIVEFSAWCARRGLLHMLAFLFRRFFSHGDVAVFVAVAMIAVLVFVFLEYCFLFIV